MAYRLLSLTAISGEFPTDQLNRLPGSPYYLESVVTALKKDGLLRTYYRDKLRDIRLGPRAKATLLAATVWGREPKPLCWKAGRTGLPAT